MSWFRQRPSFVLIYADSRATDKIDTSYLYIDCGCDDNQVLITKPIHSIIPDSD